MRPVFEKEHSYAPKYEKSRVLKRWQLKLRSPNDDALWGA